MIITSNVFRSYLECRYKACLLLEGKSGQSLNHQALTAELDNAYKSLAQSALSRGFRNVDTAGGCTDTQPLIKFETRIILDPFDFVLDTVKIEKTSSMSEAGQLPVIFCRSAKIPRSEELRLAIAGHVLRLTGGSSPATGIVVHGPTCSTKFVRLTPKYAAAQRILAELVSFADGECRPPLILNNHCPACEFQSRCKEEAKAQDNLSLLNRMTEKTIRQYNRKGIFTVNQLSYTFHPRRRSKRAKAHGRPHSYPLQALALRDQKVYVLNPPTFAHADTQVFIDMEGDTNGHFVYLIGLLVVCHGQEKCYSFWAETREDEGMIFDQLVQVLSNMVGPILYHYGPYESRVLKRAVALGGAPGKLSQIVEIGLVNILGQVYSRIYFPTYSNSLKDIAAYLGYVWRTPEANGLDAATWRARWELTRDRALKEKLIEYNLDDCRALRILTSFLQKIVDDVSAPNDALKPDVVAVESLEDESRKPSGEWGKKKFAIPEFEAVTKCSYFDYQKSRVFLRTNPALRPILRRQQKNERKPAYRVTRTVEVRARRCPYCKGTVFSRNGNGFRTKHSFDLRISRAGITRQVIRFRSKIYRCSSCDGSFVSRSFTAKECYGHSLAAWAVHQHVANRISFQNLETTLRECFSLPVNFRYIYEFKARFAQYYDETYRRILDRLRSGPLLHADETKVNFQTGSGYVWVFTNMEEVAFVVKPDRNASFLHEMLSGFGGVLVSDFFSGYDSLKCAQQKCLIHLMRDLNDSLLADPFDSELKELGHRFGQVLQVIIATVDRFGLKARLLRRHKPEVDRFFSGIEIKTSDSEAVRTLKKRVLKYRERLFTFLDYDGVPWNNNNAEHAVKHFAKYRSLVNGRVTEGGLRDYLTLLSIYQTCKYKSINCLEFLLSKERDIDAFAAGR
jgi:predicted RecB family nuclease